MQIKKALITDMIATNSITKENNCPPGYILYSPLSTHHCLTIRISKIC
ncbi:MAG: hypothetical protein J5778_07250 [Clostridiales bacterium]|nr:hypothetical protein [Clostridiales bacterium]